MIEQRFATVTALGPLRIRMDGDTDPLPVSVLSLVQPRVGDRVSVRVEGTMRVVDGILGGGSMLASGAGTLGPAWSGSAFWQRVGDVVTVQYAATRINSPFTLNAWTLDPIVTGLPAAVDRRSTGMVNGVHGIMQSNALENASSAFSPAVSGTTLYVEARWVNRAIAVGNWFSGVVTYEAA